MVEDRPELTQPSPFQLRWLVGTRVVARSGKAPTQNPQARYASAPI